MKWHPRFLEECKRTKPSIDGLAGERIHTFGGFFFSNERILRNEDAYVTSFCADDDLLSQWRGYAMGGFSVGFVDLASKGKFAIQSSLWNTTVRKVLYQHTEKKSELIRIVTSAIKATDKVPSGPQQNGIVSMIATVCAFELQAWAHSVKDRSFEAECEWRLMSFTTPYQETLTEKHNFFVRLRDNQLVPTIRLKAGEDKLLPIASITCGPNANSKLTKGAIELLLASRGYDSIPVKTSRIPFRAT